MGHSDRVKENKSIFNVAKNYRSFVFVLTVISLANWGCSHSTKSNEKDEKDEKQMAETFKKAMDFRPSGVPITKLGSNNSPIWSPDGKKFLFVSKNRNIHKNAQIYEWDFSTASERRVTFSDGDSFSPTYALDGEKIIYASTTDELKERPLLIQKKAQSVEKFPPSDLYMSNLNGLEIVRMTNHPGFDGIIHLASTKDNEIYFSSETNGQRIPQKMKLNSKTSSPLFLDRVERFDYVQFNEHASWIEVIDGKSQLMSAERSLKTAKPISFGEVVFKDLSWIPATKKGEGSLLATASFKESPNTQIVVIDLAQKCLSVLAKADKANLSEASLSPDKKRLLYSTDELPGTNQILMKTIDWNEIKCERPATTQ